MASRGVALHCGWLIGGQVGRARTSQGSASPQRGRWRGPPVARLLLARGGFPTPPSLPVPSCPAPCVWRRSVGGATAQRQAELAWHRRQRRHRAAARVLVRLAAASRTLQAHHSAQRPPQAPAPAMPSGPRRGGNAVAGEAPLLARFDQLEKMVRALHEARGVEGGGTARGNGQQRGPNGGYKRGGGGGGAAGGAGVRSRPGDWTCGACGAFPCFAKATSCFACRTPRPRAGEAASEQRRGNGVGGSVSRPVSTGSYLGPVGANGSRPMLGGRGPPPAGPRRESADATCPSVRVPGASVAARVAQGRAANAAAENVDVVGEQRGPAPASDAPPAPRAPWSNPPAPPVRTANRWSALAEAPEDDDSNADDGDGMHDIDEADNQDEDEEEGGATEPAAATLEREPPEPTPAQLRLEWDRHCAALRLLEKDAGSVPPALIVEARRLRDQAESRWRAAKPQQPLHKRVRWAESELREAQGKEDARRKELDEHLAAAARRTREIEARLEVDSARTKRKKAALEDLQHRQALARCPAAESAARMAITGISSDVAPAMSAIAASLGEGDEEKRKQIQFALQSLARVEEVLREGTRAAEQGRPPEGALGGALGTEHFNIGDNAAETANGTSLPHQTPPSPNSPQRWEKTGPTGQWKKARTSSDAVAEARRMLGGQCGQDAEGPQGGDSAATEGASMAHADGARTTCGPSVGEDPSRTNDLAEAARRAECQAQRQFQESLRQRSQQATVQQQLEEDERRRSREQQQQQEMQRHQAAMEHAAAERAAEEARQRDALVARMSPAELARAAEVHAQQQAVAAHAFGSLSASQVAGLVHQAHVENVVQEAAREGAQADHEYLMSLSPEEFAQWEQDRQGESGAVPW